MQCPCFTCHLVISYVHPLTHHFSRNPPHLTSSFLVGIKGLATRAIIRYTCSYCIFSSSSTILATTLLTAAAALYHNVCVPILSLFIFMQSLYYTSNLLVYTVLYCVTCTCITLRGVSTSVLQESQGLTRNMLRWYLYTC